MDINENDYSFFINMFICFLLGIFLVTSFFSQVMWSSSLLPYMPISSLILLFGCIINIFSKKSNLSLILYLILIFVGIIVYINSNTYYALQFSLALLMVRDVNFHLIIKTFLYFIGISLIITIILANSGIIPVFSSIGISNDGNITFRKSLGFVWVTFASQFYFYLVLAYFFIKKGDLGHLSIIFILLGDFYLYFETATKNPFILVILILIISILNENFKNKPFSGKYIKYISVIIFPLMSFISLLFAIIGKSNGVMVFLDNLLDNRVAMANLGFTQYGIRLFGNIIPINTFANGATNIIGNYFYLDNSYVQYLITFGSIFLIILILLLTISLINLKSGSDWYIFVIFIFIAIHSFNDPQLIYLCYSPFTLICSNTMEYFLQERKHI